ncbi:MAG: helical backbone metal receptor [Bacteroidia bacterium]
MIRIVDQTGYTIQLENSPKRIISTVPSQTELLFYIGKADQVVGVTRFCVHPKNEVKAKVNIGGTKQLKLQKIAELKPDLIIANKEENDKEQILELRKKYKVYVSDIVSIKSSIKMILDIGLMCQASKRAKQLADKIEKGFIDMPKLNATVAYLIWYKPYMAAANQTFINEVLKQIGCKNAFDDQNRYPQIGISDIVKANPDYVFLSSEPFPFKQSHINELQSELVNTKVMLVDGEMFSWYGNRMLLAIDYFKQLIINAKS